MINNRGMNLFNYILDDNGKPVIEHDLVKWAKWHCTHRPGVARETIGDSDISTVFLAFDHNYSGVGPPLLWETMVFGGRLDIGRAKERRTVATFRQEYGAVTCEPDRCIPGR